MARRARQPPGASREQLATLIDTSVFDEAVALAGPNDPPAAHRADGAAARSGRRRRRTSPARPPRSRTCARSARSSGCRPNGAIAPSPATGRAWPRSAPITSRWCCRAATREGREALEQRLRQLLGRGVDGIPAGRLNLHIWFSPVITLSARATARTGRWRHLAMLGENGVSATWRSTTDVVEYHKTRDGWRIAFIRPYGNFLRQLRGRMAHPGAARARALSTTRPTRPEPLLPDRAAAQPRAADDLAEEASLLLAQGTAQNLANAFGYYLDRGMYDDIADLFTPTATIDVAGQGVYNGAGGVRKFLGRFGEAGLQQGELNDRPLLMPLVTISDDGGDRAGAGGRTRHDRPARRAGLLVGGDRHLPATAGEDGKWRIQQLHQRPLMRADYKQGWAHPLPAAMPIGESQFPDGPPQPVDTSYPEHAVRDAVAAAGRGVPGARARRAGADRARRARAGRGVRRGRERLERLRLLHRPVRLARHRRAVRHRRMEGAQLHRHLHRPRPRARQHDRPLRRRRAERDQPDAARQDPALRHRARARPRANPHPAAADEQHARPAPAR